MKMEITYYQYICEKCTNINCDGSISSQSTCCKHGNHSGFVLVCDNCSNEYCWNCYIIDEYMGYDKGVWPACTKCGGTGKAKFY